MTHDPRPLTPAPRNEVHAISLLDKTDPRSLVNLLPGALKTALESAYEKDPVLFGMDERVLLGTLRSRKQTPTITDNRLRMKFWNEYDRVQATSTKEVNVTAIIAGICSRQFFYEHYLKSPEHVAWLLCVPASYEVVMEEALQFALEQMRDVLALPNEDASGKLNTKLIELKAKITDMLHARVKGAVVQKNLNINATPAQVQQTGEDMTMEDIQRRMKEIEKRKAQAINGGSEKVVEAELVGP